MDRGPEPGATCAGFTGSGSSRARLRARKGTRDSAPGLIRRRFSGIILLRRHLGAHLILPASRNELTARKYLMRRTLATLCALLCLGLVAGCIFSPKTDDGGGFPPPPPPSYPILSDPYNVMVAYRTAYEARDSVEMKKIYDDTYIGTSIDQSNPGNILQFTFNKAQEVSHVGAMAKVATITSVSLQLPPSLFRERDDADPPGWALIQLPPNTVRLQIDDGQTSRLIVPDKETFEFRFAPTTPDSTSPTDTTWKIVKWSELRL
jgi:hypothetical protein